MHVLAVLYLIFGGGSAALTADSVALRASRGDSGSAISNPRAQPVTIATPFPITLPLSVLEALGDTIPRRRKAVEVGEWYSRRLTIHRYVAVATIPVFAAQYAAGDQIFRKGADAPTWAKTTHRVGATSLAAMFTVNTVTGAWNWWDSRTVSQGRVLRTVHAMTMLGTDAAFTYAGAKLSNEAENSLNKRRQHRTVALASIGVTLVSELAMKILNK